MKRFGLFSRRALRGALLSAICLLVPQVSLGAELEVEAGGQDRVWCPVEVAVPDDLGLKMSVSVVNTKSDEVLPGYIRKGKLSFVLPNLVSGEKAVFEVRGESPGAMPIVVEDDAKASVATVSIGGEEFTQFHYGKELFKPFLWPVYGPEANGKPLPMTRAYPMGEADIKDDHHHHRSVWTAYGEVRLGNNETVYNAWHESDGKTTWQRVRQVKVANGTSYGWLVADLDWLSPDERVKILTEHREYRFYNTPSDARIMDLLLTFTATVSDIHFDDTKEGGFFSLRVNDRLIEEQGGVMTNSEGLTTEKEIWGRPANWVDYSGTLEGVPCGMTIFDHPTSFRHMPTWHARSYGLLTANVFGYSHFRKNAPDLPETGDFTLKKGQSITSSFRFFVHGGDCEAARVAERYVDFANPPKTTWK